MIRHAASVLASVELRLKLIDAVSDIAFLINLNSDKTVSALEVRGILLYVILNEKLEKALTSIR